MTKIIIIFFILVGVFFRLYHIEFGLPHYFHADEPEIVELAIKYTYEIKNIFRMDEFFKLIPISYVYGTFPTYISTFFTMAFSKTNNILGIGFEKMHIYVFLRVLTALSSLLIPILAMTLFFRVHANVKGAVFALALGVLNWKLIVQSHYVNPDIIQTLMLSACYFFSYRYFKETSTKTTLYTVLLSIFFGLALGTKITTLIAIPAFIYLFSTKKDLRGFIAFVLIATTVFIATNPFSLVFRQDFVFRIMEMFTKEGGVVFDSVDANPAKYLLALVQILTPAIFAMYLYGNWVIFKRREDKSFHLFLTLTIILYLLFFSLQARRVDRWLLPILPITFYFAAYGFSQLQLIVKPKLYKSMVVVVSMLYMIFPMLLLQQFARETPKSSAYKWMQQNTKPVDLKLVYSEEGLDPMNKLPGAKVYTVQVYPEQNAQFFVPTSTDPYKYVIVSSRPLAYYKKDEIREIYPFYYDKWKVFETNLQDKGKFKLAKEFVLPKPNLIPLSDVLIYEKVN